MKYVAITLFLILVLSMNALTLQEARELALQNNPDLLATEQTAKSSKAGLWKSYLGLIPSATWTGRYTKYDEDFQIGLSSAEESRSYGYTITQPIFYGGNLWLAARLSNDAYKIAENSLQSKRLETIAETESKYFVVLENKALWDIASKSLKNAATNLEIAEIQFHSGSISKADYLNLQAEKANKEVYQIQMENLYKTSLLDLENFLQCTMDDELEEIPIEKYSAVITKLQELDLKTIDRLTENIERDGLKQNPALKISEISVASSKKALLMTGGKFLPSINLQYSKSWQKYDFDDDYDSSGQLGINVSFPLFPLVDNGLGVAKANYEYKKSKFSLESTQNSISLAIKNSVLGLVTAAKTVKSSKLAMQYAKETYDQMQERFKNGMISSNDLLAAELMYSNAQSQYVSNFYDFLRARSGLMQLIGIEDEKLFDKYFN